MRSLLPLAAALAAACPLALAQSPLTTTFAGGNGQNGNMFDIVGVNPVVITGFDVNMASASATVEIYAVTAGTTYVGNETNAAAWTLLGSVPNVVSAGAGQPTPVPLPINVPITPGQTQGFYVTVTSGTLSYTNGSSLGSVYVQNSDIQFLEGIGKSYPFGATFSPRIWNGNIYYQPAGGNFATKSLYGVGCYDSPRMAHEEFPGDTSPVDLANTSWTMVYQPGNSGGNYTIIAGGNPYDGVTPATNGIDLVTQAFTSSSSANWDDASIVQALPFAFPYPNATSATATDITVNSNGRIYLGASFDTSFASNGANSGFTPTSFAGTTGAGLPMIAGFMCDLDPTVGGNIWYENPSPSGGVRITWHNILNWQDAAYTGLPAQPNYIQMELLPGGIVYLSFGQSLGNGGSANNVAITGFSAGAGEPEGPQLDWSSLNGYQTGTGDVPLEIDASGRPVTGTSINIDVTQIPAGSLAAAVVFGAAKLDPGIPLAGVGMPGCSAYTTPDSLVAGLVGGASFTVPLSVPNNPSLSGVALHAQGLVLSSTIPNAFGGITSNGVELIVGIN